MGDEVVLNIRHIKNFYPHLLAKIKVWWVRPFIITHKVLLVAYWVDLPLGCHLHPIFHIDKLKHYISLEEF